MTPAFLPISNSFWDGGGTKEKNYDTYYRSARVQFSNKFEHFSELYQNIFSVYLGLSWSFLVYLSLEGRDSKLLLFDFFSFPVIEELALLITSKSVKY